MEMAADPVAEAEAGGTVYPEAEIPDRAAAQDPKAEAADPAEVAEAAVLATADTTKRS